MGTCCSLSNESSTGGCTVTTSDGHCFWEPKECDCGDGSLDCTREGIQYLSISSQACPPSSFDPFVQDPTASEPPAAGAPATQAPVTEAPITEPPVTQPLATDPSVVGPPISGSPATEPTDNGSQPGQPGTVSPIVISTPSSVTALPTINEPFTSPAPSDRPTVESLTEFCGDSESPCELIQRQSCTDFITENNFVGTCCALVHVAETGECIVRVSYGHCFWEPADRSFNPLYGCESGAGIFHTSLSDEPCPPSNFDVFDKKESPSMEQNEHRASLLTNIWVSVLLVLVISRILVCFEKIYADKKSMREDEEQESGLQSTGNNRPDLGWVDAEGGMQSIDLQQQAQRGSVERAFRVF
jgi:hypothetical protein